MLLETICQESWVPALSHSPVLLGLFLLTTLPLAEGGEQPNTGIPSCCPSGFCVLPGSCGLGADLTALSVPGGSSKRRDEL